MSVCQLDFESNNSNRECFPHMQRLRPYPALLESEDKGGFMETRNTQTGNEDAGEVITLSQAGEILHASYSTVRRLVLSGELKGFRIRNSWRTSTTACDEFIRNRFDEQSSICKSTDGI